MVIEVKCYIIWMGKVVKTVRTSHLPIKRDHRTTGTWTRLLRETKIIKIFQINSTWTIMLLWSFRSILLICIQWIFTGVTCGAGIAYPYGAHEFIASFSVVRVTRSFVFCVVFFRSLFAILSLFFWPLCCLSFDLWILITSLVSSNSSYINTYNWYLIRKSSNIQFWRFPMLLDNVKLHFIKREIM